MKLKASREVEPLEQIFCSHHNNHKECGRHRSLLRGCSQHSYREHRMHMRGSSRSST